jgi:seryl-tRNA synthetase
MTGISVIEGAVSERLVPETTTSGAVERRYRDELVEQGLLFETGVAGLYGRSGGFEDTLLRVDGMIERAGEDDAPEVMRFPPILPRLEFERSGFLKSFPHLVGAIHCFAGGEAAHRGVLRRVDAGEDWSAAFTGADIVLTPAACYPVYPRLRGALPRGGRVVDVMSYCFRHEPSEDAGRMQMFRMHEFVRAGDAATIGRWREQWMARAQAFVAALGLESRHGAASDPFFGRGGRLLADSQRDQGLKIEFTAPIASDEQPTAIVSLNNHQEHFARIYGIAAADGSVAHTSCIGFGLERIVLALYRRHGFRRDRWPEPVRGALRL